MQRQVHSRYIDRCINNLFYLKEITWFPLDIVYVISNLGWKLRPEPVFIIYQSEDPIILNSQIDIQLKCNTVINKSKELYSGLRCYNQYVSNQDYVGQLLDMLVNYNKINPPRLASWFELVSFPFGLLIPGSVYDQMISNNYDNINGIQILNGYIYKNELYTYNNNVKLYPYAHSSEIIEWLFRALNNFDFLKIQNTV